ncbi:MAG: hypothetical protein ACR2KM_11420 [Gemmatimonadaceae bacterium]
MGKYNSSTYRVQPVFDALRAKDKTGRSWLAPLLELPGRTGRQQLALSPDRVGEIQEAAWSPAERALPPPRGLLLDLAMHTQEPKPGRKREPGDAWGGGEVGVKRRLLHARDAATQQEACELLFGTRVRSPGLDSWEILEGPTCPDVYLQTPTTIIVIEGKFTEDAPTTDTKWMRVRSQMLRHIDAAWDQRDGRDVYGFFIVEDDDARAWKTASADTLTPEMVSKSLPHRSDATQAEITNGFLGSTAWEKVCAKFGLPKSLLKSTEEIDAARSPGQPGDNHGA